MYDAGQAVIPNNPVGDLMTLRTYVCTFVRMYICTDVHMYVCMYVHLMVGDMGFLVLCAPGTL